MIGDSPATGGDLLFRTGLIRAAKPNSGGILGHPGSSCLGHPVLTVSWGRSTLRDTMTPLQDLTVEQLRKLVAIREQIETLQSEIDLIAGGGSPSTAPLRRRGRRKKSRSQAARIAVTVRWAKVKAERAEAEPKRRRKMSAVTRARMADAAKARWAKAKAAGKNRL